VIRSNKLLHEIFIICTATPYPKGETAVYAHKLVKMKLSGSKFTSFLYKLCAVTVLKLMV